MKARGPTALDFLEASIPDLESDERIEIREITPYGVVKQRFFRDKAAALAWAVTLIETHHIYYGPVLRRVVNDSIAGDEKHLSRFQDLWADVDFKCFADGEHGALAAMRNLPLHPSAIIRTGNGLHTHFILDQAYEPEDAADARAASRGVTDFLNAYAVHALDRVDDQPHVMRLPGTLNHKAAPPLEVEIVHLNGERYSLQDFRREGLWAPIKKSDEAGGGHSSWTSHEPLDPDAILDGVPHGDRNKTLFRYVCRLRGEGRSYNEAKTLVLAAAAACRAAADAPYGSDPYPENDALRVFERAWKRYEPNEDRNGERPDTSGTQPNELRWQARPLSELTASADIRWLLHGIAARGVMTLLTGLWKAGKTTLLVHILVALADGRPFCGLETTPARVLVISEEPEAVWVRRRDEIGIADHVHLINRPFVGKPDITTWEAFLAHVADIVRHEHFDLVVLDSLPNLWPVQDENDAAKVLAGLMPLYALTEAGAGVLALMHPKKGDAGQGQATRGSGAIGGFMDVLMEMRRFKPEDRDDRRRVLTGYSRFDETLSELVISYDTIKGYTAVGGRGDVRRADRLITLLPLLPTALPGKTVEELREAWPDEPVPSKRTLQRDLGLAVSGGEVDAIGEGKGRRYGRKGFGANGRGD
jgi:AAA domain